MSTWFMFMFQESNSYYADNLISFHNMVMMIIIMISTLTVYIIMDLFLNKFSNLFLLKNHNIEIIWTVIPIIILLIICFPSLKILYLIDEIVNPFFSVKSIGHQWYWSYEYPEFNNIEFDSYMLNYKNLNQFRLLETDNRMIIPMNIPLRLITTSTDVIHSWTVPSLGIKVDAVPGRINQLNLISKRPGIFFGQCSEICGMNHSFMPIMVESTSFKYFLNWVNKQNN
uniref:Cytochrome c oxidase subunit 2 n=2 Tax=Apis cerana TaxID=7461 RepID=Q8LU90_APICE|nr:cytochrome c oxidase subunit II [Apis cerana]BAV58414.1 cytochrome c oxidase subunit II [Apis cerana japonica]BAC06192.1 cytochrome oxidase 2 [Apis cerana]BAC06193.1 cytochrome oxidase 2 [Apis cerana]BAC06194.1 cytochrome oxidase 2 [Apis cerana]